MLDNEPNERHEDASTDNAVDMTDEVKVTRRRRTRSKVETPEAGESATNEDIAPSRKAPPMTSVLFMAPSSTDFETPAEPAAEVTSRRRRRRSRADEADEPTPEVAQPVAEDEEQDDEEESGRRRRRGRRGRGRGKGGSLEDGSDDSA